MSHHDDITRRLDALEQQNRRLRLLGGGLALAVVAGGLMSFAGPRMCRTIWGERIVLKDSSLRERMVLDAYSTDLPTLTLNDEQGQRIAAMSVQENGGLQFKAYDKKGNPRKSAFRLDEDGNLTIAATNGDNGRKGKQQQAPEHGID